MKMEITGNTYQHKDAIKAIGGKWNGNNRVWEIDESKQAQVEALGLRLTDTEETKIAKLAAELNALPTVTKFRVRPTGGGEFGGKSLFDTREEAESAAKDFAIFGVALEIVEEIRRAR